ncbi:MAG: hypothetical protein Kow002_01280 [Anaerolineales bacterium]
MLAFGLFLFPSEPGVLECSAAGDCPQECQEEECVWWVAGPSDACPAPGPGGGCCLEYKTVCDDGCLQNAQLRFTRQEITCSQWGNNAWCVGTQTLKLTVIDPRGKSVHISGQAGDAPFACPAGNGSVSCEIPLPAGQGTVTFVAAAIDGRTLSGSAHWQRDPTPPQINGALTGTPGANGWYASEVQVSASASDAGGSALASLEYNLNDSGWHAYTAPLRLTDGTHTIHWRAFDRAGNRSDHTQTVRVDTHSPDIDLSLSGTSGQAGWYISPVEISLSGSDTGSGLALLEYATDGVTFVPYSTPLTFADGEHTLTLRATDAAGNTSAAVQGIKVDTLGPQIEISLNGSRGANGWYLSDVQLSLSGSDAGAGLASLEFSQAGGAWTPYTAPITFQDGKHSWQLRAVDRAGNQTLTPPQQVWVDTVAPVIDLPAAWRLGTSPAFKVQDDGSGLWLLRTVIEDEKERYPKVAHEISLSGKKYRDVLTWDGRFRNGLLAPPGAYLAWVKVSDQAGHETRAYGLVHVEQDTPPIPVIATPTAVLSNEPPPTVATPPPVETRFGGNEHPRTGISSGTTFSGVAVPPENPLQTNTATPWAVTAAGALGGLALETLRRSWAGQRVEGREKRQTVRFESQPAPEPANPAASPVRWGQQALAAVAAFQAEIERRRKAAQAYKAIQKKYAAAMEAQAPEAEDFDPLKNRDFRRSQVAQARANERERWEEKRRAIEKENDPTQNRAWREEKLSAAREKERGGYFSNQACTPENIQQPKSRWQREGKWVQEQADNIAEGFQGTWDASKLRHLKFTQLESGKISVRAETPPGTRLSYRTEVLKEGFDFAGTRYNHQTVSSATSKGLWKGAWSKGSLALAGLVSFGTNLLEFGSGQKFGTQEYWDATVKKREFWVSTGVDVIVSVAAGLAAAAVVAGAIALFAGTTFGTLLALPAVAIIAAVGVGFGISLWLEAHGIPEGIKAFINNKLSGEE